MSYIVSARKYRPSTFDSVIGQKALTATLKNAVATGRLAHAYLFTGSRGVGKTSCARIFAKTINCQHPTEQGEACNECDSCRAFNEGTSLNIIELDAASHNGVDDIKSLIEQVMVPPTYGRYRVFIIDEVHMLSAAAFNAFLKTLEEPPEYAIFVLATTEKHKIIPTILSRCQIYDFNRITIADMVEHLSNVARQEGIETDRASLSVIAKQADGAMRDALSIFDQVAAAAMGHITYEKTIENLNILDSSYYKRLVEAFLTQDVPSALMVYKEVRDKGFDSQFFINGLGQYLRDLMVAMVPQTLSLLDVSDEEKAEYQATAAKCTPQFLYKAMDLCNDADLNFRVAANKQFLIELTLIKQCQLLSPSPIDGAGEGQLKPIAAQSKEVEHPAQRKEVEHQAQSQVVERPAQHNTSSETLDLRGQASAPKPVAPKHPMPDLGPSTLSIRKFKRVQEAPAATPVAAATPAGRANAYTIEALHDQWRKYAEQHPTERILVNTMAAALPQPKQGDGAVPDKYIVLVDDQIQVDMLVDSKPEILHQLRNALGNDNIDFEVQISVSTEGSSVTWTQKEVLQYFAEQKPIITKLISDFGFTLA